MLAGLPVGGAGAALGAEGRVGVAGAGLGAAEAAAELDARRARPRARRVGQDELEAAELGPRVRAAQRRLHGAALAEGVAVVRELEAVPAPASRGRDDGRKLAVALEDAEARVRGLRAVAVAGPP